MLTNLLSVTNKYQNAQTIIKSEYKITKDKFRISDEHGKIDWYILEGILSDSMLLIEPHSNYFILKAEFTLFTTARLPFDIYLMDLWLDDNKIENIPLFNQNSTFLYTEVEIPLDSENIFTKLSDSRKIPVKIEFKLNENLLTNLNFKMEEIDKFKSCIKENKTFWKRNILFTNYKFVNNIPEGNVELTKSMWFKQREDKTNFLEFKYKYAFKENIEEKQSIKKIIYICTDNEINWDISHIQYDFNYYVNTSNKMYKFSLSQNEYEPKNFIENTLVLPTGLKYNYDTKLFEKGNYKTGFYLPEGGYGFLLTTIDFKNENNLSQKIIWKQPFSFNSLSEQIKNKKIFDIKSEKIYSLNNFFTKSGEINVK